MPVSFLELLSYCSLNRRVHRVALLLSTVRQLQKDSSNVTAADTESPVSQTTTHTAADTESPVSQTTPHTVWQQQSLSTFNP